MQTPIELTIPLIIGLFLGLLGGGGTTLAVPALIYVFGFETKMAIAISLLVVGISSLIASFIHFYRKNIRILCTLVFGVSGMTGSYMSAKMIAPLLSNKLQLLLFAVLVLLIATLMLRKKHVENNSFTNISLTKKCLLSSLSGLCVGIITGVIGVGGGFLIVPTLMYLMNLSMIEAIASSLVIISLQSIAAFMAYSQYLEIPLEFAFKFTALVILGSFIGTAVAVKINQALLKKIFAILLLVIGLFVLVQNLVL